MYSFSWLPWFDAFYKMLDIASELLAESGGQRALAEFLQEIYDHEVPGPKIPVSIIASQQVWNLVLSEKIFHFQKKSCLSSL